MAENKKSVLLYCDIIYTVEELDDADAGLLFKHYLRYINDQNPEPPSKLIKIVFEPIKQNLKRDLKKWEETTNNRSKAGLAGADARWQKVASDGKRINPMAKMAVIDKDTVTVKDIEISHDFEFKSSFAQIFNKPYPKERGIDGAGRDVDTILAQLSHIPKEEILKTAKAMRAVYQSQKLHLPTNVATLINSFTGTDWQERLKALDPEHVAENISKERKNGKQRTPEPDTIGTSAPGSLG